MDAFYPEYAHSEIVIVDGRAARTEQLGRPATWALARLIVATRAMKSWICPGILSEDEYQ